MRNSTSSCMSLIFAMMPRTNFRSSRVSGDLSRSFERVCESKVKIYLYKALVPLWWNMLKKYNTYDEDTFIQDFSNTTVDIICTITSDLNVLGKRDFIVWLRSILTRKF